MDLGIIIKIHKEGGYIPPVIPLRVDLGLELVKRVVTWNKWNDCSIYILFIFILLHSS